MSARYPWTAIFLLLLGGRIFGQPPDDPVRFYIDKVKPLLTARCYACHTQAAMGGLRLDSREALIKGGDSGPAHSEVVQNVAGPYRPMKSIGAHLRILEPSACQRALNIVRRVSRHCTSLGEKEDSPSEIKLELIDGGFVVATASLVAGVQGSLLKKFGDTGMITLSGSQLLFELPASQAALVNGAFNGTVFLRVAAKSTNGQQATKDVKSVEKLVKFEGTKRYLGRNDNEGGDDWVKPNVKPVFDHFTEVTYGDFSNMNGGYISPHAWHKTGNDVDGWFDGYNARDDKTAEKMVTFLNDATYGKRIVMVWVAFENIDSNKFWTAIKDVTLADGRKASTVILPEAVHTGHFHWRISD